MKREGNLLGRIVDRDNLLLAFLLASRGRRAAREVVEFRTDLDGNLTRMAEQITAGTIEVGRFTSFTIRDPKPRRIFAPAFAERVLHHAILAVAGERLDRYLIDQTYACRLGLGTHAAVQQAQQYARRHSHVLQLDVRHYFGAIDQARLLGQLRRLWKDEAVLALIGRIVASYEVEPGKGLPIGSLTSQHLANVHLGAFDHFAKEQLGCRGYVPYMDDMLLFGDDAERLRAWLAAARVWLGDELGLQLKPPLLRAVQHGFDFLGVRVRRSHLTLTGSRKRRWAVAMARLWHGLAVGALDEAGFARRAGSMVAHARSVCSRGFRGHVLARLRAAAPGSWSRLHRPARARCTGERRAARGSGRQLEQRAGELPVGEPEQQRPVQREQQPGLPPSARCQPGWCKRSGARAHPAARRGPSGQPVQRRPCRGPKRVREALGW